MKFIIISLVPINFFIYSLMQSQCGVGGFGGLDINMWQDHVDYCWQRSAWACFAFHIIAQN